MDLGDILGKPVIDDAEDVKRIVATLVEMQRGINMLTEILSEHRARIMALEQENARLKAITAPRQSSLIRIN